MSMTMTEDSQNRRWNRKGLEEPPKNDASASMYVYNA